MSFRIPHSAFRIRKAHTLVELMVAAVSSSMLLAALGSTMYIAGKVAYTPVHAQKLLDATSMAGDLVDELKHAVHIVDYGATFVEFVTDDRDGDGVEDTIRYAWSGTPGDPVTHSFNRGTPVSVMDDVHQLQLDYTIEQSSDDVEVLTAGTDQALANLYSKKDDVRLKQYEHYARTIELSGLPSTAASWSLRKISYQADNAGGQDGSFAVQLRQATSQGSPTSEVIEEWIVPENTLPSWNWYDLYPTRRISGLSLHENYCVVFKWLSDTEAAKIGRTDSAVGMWSTLDDGATWTQSPDRQLQVIVHAAPETADAPLVLPADRLTGVSVSLQIGDSHVARIDTSVRLDNGPLLALGVVGTEFESDPTAQDRNGDGNDDFTQAGGGAFDSTDLADGWWDATDNASPLTCELTDDLSQPIDVRFRAQATTAGNSGAVLELHVRTSTTTKGRVAANVWLNAGGNQNVDLWVHDGSTLIRQARVDGLPDEPVEVRLVADPLRRVWTCFVEGAQVESLEFPEFSGSLPKHSARMYDLGTQGKFDYVHIRQPQDG